MSLNIFHKTGSGTGVLQKIAGHTILLDANVSEVREGTATFTPGAASYYDSTVTFTDPMPDTDYIVLLETGTFPGMSEQMGQPNITDKTTTGFNVRYFCNGNPDSRGGTMHYYAFKLIKIDGYTELQNKVNNPDSTPTEDSLNLVTSGGVYDAIKDSGKIWRGTQEEWDALPSADKDFYDQAEISGVNNDGMVYVADKIENGNMNAVTSNAVAKITSHDPSEVTWNPTYIDLGTWASGGLLEKCGIVQFSKIFTVKAGVPAGTVLCSGLPTPAMNTEISVSWDDYTATGGFFLNTSGELSSWADVTTDTICRINIVYIKA